MHFAPTYCPFRSAFPVDPLSTVQGLVHVAAGCILFFSFLLMAISIESVQSTRDDPIYLFTFALVNASLFFFWILRYLQIAIACPEVS